jgi:hypothetical protein
MKSTIKIRFTEPQIELVMRAHPNCNLDRLTELSFEFDQDGNIVDCVGTIKDGGNIDRDYTGSGLARLYETARRKLAERQVSATILPCRCVEMIPRKLQAPEIHQVSKASSDEQRDSLNRSV